MEISTSRILGTSTGEIGGSSMLRSTVCYRVSVYERMLIRVMFQVWITTGVKFRPSGTVGCIIKPIICHIMYVYGNVTDGCLKRCVFQDPARPKYEWMADHTENMSGTSGQWTPYTTTRPKVEAWTPKAAAAK